MYYLCPFQKVESHSQQQCTNPELHKECKHHILNNLITKLVAEFSVFFQSHFFHRVKLELFFHAVGIVHCLIYHLSHIQQLQYCIFLTAQRVKSQKGQKHFHQCIILQKKSKMVLNNELKRGCKKGINKTMEVFISETIALIKKKKEVLGR